MVTRPHIHPREESRTTDWGNLILIALFFFREPVEGVRVFVFKLNEEETVGRHISFARKINCCIWYVCLLFFPPMCSLSLLLERFFLCNYLLPCIHSFSSETRNKMIILQEQLETARYFPFNYYAIY